MKDEANNISNVSAGSNEPAPTSTNENEEPKVFKDTPVSIQSTQPQNAADVEGNAAASEGTQLKPRKVKGTATIYNDGKINFDPQREGRPVQKSVRKKGESSFYETEGVKQSSLVAHLKVSRDGDDPVSEMYELLGELTKDYQKKEAPKPKGKCLLDKDGVSIWLNKAQQKVFVHMELDVQNIFLIQKQLFNLTSSVNSCLAINAGIISPKRSR